MSLGKYILDADGNPILEPDVLKWAMWFEGGKEKCIVARGKFGNVEVLTDFLALDFNYERNGPPLLWETLVRGGPYDGWTWRYSTLEAAKLGHLEILELVKRDIGR